MTQLELSYDDMPPLSEDSLPQPPQRVLTQQISEFIDLQLVDLAAANDVWPSQGRVDGGLNPETAVSDLVATSGEGLVPAEQTVDKQAPNFVVVGGSQAATETWIEGLTGANCQVQLLDVEAFQTLSSLSVTPDVALIDCTDFDWAVDQIHACKRHPSSHRWALITHGLATPEQRCELLELGVVEVLASDLDEQEKRLRSISVAKRQRLITQYSEKPLHYPASGAFHMPYLIGVGNTLYATAQRGHISLVVAVMRLTEAALEKQPDIGEFITCCQRNLRDTDVFARSADNEFVAVVTNATRHNISAVFERLAERVADGIALEPGVQAMEIGVTADSGVTFEGMIKRASGALRRATASEQFLVLD